MTGQQDDFERAALEWAKDQFGEGVHVDGFASMPGNSGLSFGFDVIDSEATVGSYVVRMAPPGVRRSGNTDVLRQVPLLEALDRADVPIARLVWHGDESSPFGTDAIIQHRLPGHSFNMNNPHEATDPGRGPLDYVERAVAALAKVHAVDSVSRAAARAGLCRLPRGRGRGQAPGGGVSRKVLPVGDQAL